jgi:dephospho-CoA kinase
MLKVGLTGGMACGKSFVAAELAKLGCHVIEADEVGHEVLEPGGEAYDAVLAAFGPEILDADGRIDRTRLGARVFGDSAQLDKLNSIVHPAVRTRATRAFAEIGARDPHGIVVYVAAILLESGAYKEVDKIIVVSCARAQQIERAMHRPDATQAGVLARLERQMPLEKKKEFADYIIDTSGAKEDTLRQTEMVYRELRRLSAQARPEAKV